MNDNYIIETQVRNEMLAEFNRVKLDSMEKAEAWLSFAGYSKLSTNRYKDFIQAWTSNNSVAKVQKIPSGKYLIQEFKIA